MPGNDTAFALVGEFQFHFANMEGALNSCVAKVLGIGGTTAAVVTGTLDFAKKVALVLAAIDANFSRDNHETARKLLNKVRGENDPHRQNIIHSRFLATGHSEVTFFRTTARDKLEQKIFTWTPDDFHQHFSRMASLANELAALEEQLEPYVPSLDFSDPRNSGFVAML
ncbi:hypothetical protein [Bradyrhizobium sp. S3.9.1]|uniref:hypothetical protein n=1 Tax=Bradyrhizobium sp. S3.9.1 TaxID=3156431 RepID=UPI003398B450